MSTLKFNHNHFTPENAIAVDAASIIVPDNSGPDDGEVYTYTARMKAQPPEQEWWICQEFVSPITCHGYDPEAVLEGFQKAQRGAPIFVHREDEMSTLIGLVKEFRLIKGGVEAVWSHIEVEKNMDRPIAYLPLHATFADMKDEAVKFCQLYPSRALYVAE